MGLFSHSHTLRCSLLVQAPAQAVQVRFNSASFKQAIAVNYLPMLTAAVQFCVKPLWCHSQL